MAKKSVPTTEVVTLRDSQFPMTGAFEYHIEGSEIKKVLKVCLLSGERREMPYRKGKRNVFEDNKGKFIRLEGYKHYLNN